jgi:hypothetical protein
MQLHVKLRSSAAVFCCLLVLLTLTDALAIAEGRGNAVALSEAVAQAGLGKVRFVPDHISCFVLLLHLSA